MRIKKNEMKIVEIFEFNKEQYDTVRRLLGFLFPEPVALTEADYKEILASNNSHLFFLYEDEVVAGMVSVGFYRTPSAAKAWIEDVVVDDIFRGKGYGRMLTQHAIDFAKSKRAELAMLTTNAKRIAANRLYQSIGFERKDTNVYRMPL
jgi:ribosomal protein S18 acetylase RimI-like enzyme